MKQLITSQLVTPRGFIGRFVLPYVWNHHNKSLNDVTLATLAPDVADRILEIGFGGGRLLKGLVSEASEGYVVGIDSSSELASRAQHLFYRQIQTEHMEIQCADVHNLPFPNVSFDKVYSVNSIFYWKDMLMGLSEIYRVLHEDGILIITFTAAACLKNRFCFADSIHRLEPESIRKLFAEVGFKQIRIETHQDKTRIFYCCVARK